MRIFADPEVMRFGHGVRSISWMRDWLRHRLQEYEQGVAITKWAVVHRRSAQLIGYCGLCGYPDLCGQPETEIGYRLARAFWGYGYATEAAQAVLENAFTQLRISRLIALIDPGNLASRRVAEKLGMRYEREVMLEGYDYPDHLYAVER